MLRMGVVIVVAVKVTVEVSGVMVVVVASAAVLSVLLSFISKNYLIICLSLYRIFRGRLLELYSPKVTTVSGHSSLH